VGVQIDPAGRDDESACIDDFAAQSLLEEIITNRGDTLPNRRHIRERIQALCGVDHAATAHDQIKHLGLQSFQNRDCAAAGRRG
jgi:hypothetical protein